MSNLDTYEESTVSGTNSTWPTWPSSSPIRLLTVLMSMAMCFGMGGILAHRFQWALVAGIVSMFVGSFYGFLFGAAIYVDHLRIRNQRKGV